jgi:hypothetical protein
MPEAAKFRELVKELFQARMEAAWSNQHTRFYFLDDEKASSVITRMDMSFRNVKWRTCGALVDIIVKTIVKELFPEYARDASQYECSYVYMLVRRNPKAPNKSWEEIRTEHEPFDAAHQATVDRKKLKGYGLRADDLSDLEYRYMRCKQARVVTNEVLREFTIEEALEEVIKEAVPCDQ